MTSLLDAQKTAWHAPLEARMHRTKSWIPHGPDPKRWVLRGKSRADEPAKMHPQLDPALQQFRELSQLEEDWDDAGASRIHPSTIDAATALLRAAATAVLERLGRSVPLPMISGCHDGSIDLFWKTETYRLLINVKEPHGRESDFYGETRGGLKFKGSFQSESLDAHVIPVLLELVNSR